MKQPLSENIIFTLDSYKDLHDLMLEPGVTKGYSYLEARKGAEYPFTTFVGLQPILKKWLEGPVVTKEKVDQAEEVLTEHFKFSGKVWNRAKWDHIVDNHGGFLPIRIRAVDEGTSVPISNILMDVVNTDNESAWLPGALETVLQQVWYPSTVCTRSKVIVDIIKKYFRETVDDDLQWLAD